MSFPKRIIESSQWLAGLWSQREKIANKPSLILWGKKDIAFRTKELERWKETFVNAKIHEFDDFGHFVQEEMGEELCPVIERFLVKSLA